MRDQYHIDLEKYSLQKFKKDLQSRDMIPSRVNLKDDLDVRFGILESEGISNMRELVDALKTKQKVENFSIESGLTVAYLTLIKREANSYLPSPIRLDKLPGIPAEYLDNLAAVGIKNSRQLFTQAKRKDDRELLSQETGIPIDILDELTSLSDLSRAYGIGPVFARMIYDAGIKSIKALVEYTAGDLIRLYEEKTGKKADFGVNEIQFSLDLAGELETSVEC